MDMLSQKNQNLTLAKRLSGRYGSLALTRAAGEAAAATRQGDKEKAALWLGVVVDLRQTLRHVREQPMTIPQA